jgi:hypothetical protein
VDEVSVNKGGSFAILLIRYYVCCIKQLFLVRWIIIDLWKPVQDVGKALVVVFFYASFDVLFDLLSPRTSQILS